jgi:S1-C subfamily serine protease
MRIATLTSVFLTILGVPVVQAQNGILAPDTKMQMEVYGSAVVGKGLSVIGLEHLPSKVPTTQLSKLVQDPILEIGESARSVRDAQIYRETSPSVVLVANKDGFGSGSLLTAAGDVLTNRHVVSGYEYVAIIFKPTIEGVKPTRDEIKVGRIIKYDEIADLALVKAFEVPPGRSPIRLGDPSEIAVGMDVHAIGHPTGQAWTYTKGVISQYRQTYEWQAQDDPITHNADVIQTQTPINPGNSGGPLISSAGTLIGVNSFKGAGEGLNFAVSVDDVRRFLARSGNRVASSQPVPRRKQEACEPREVFKSRNKENNATIVGYDIKCSGKVNAEYVYPDKKTDPVLLKLDRNGDGRADVIFFDFKRQGKWELSWWDENFDGHWTLVGYHDDGGITPTRLESFEAYQRRLAKR